MDEPVRHMETDLDGVPLSSWIIDESETIKLGDEEIEFRDPSRIVIESGVRPMEPETMVRMVAIQELRKAIGDKKGVFAYLFYLRREESHPFFAVRVVENEMDVEVLPDVKSP